jgi:hypothetical protein
MNRKQNEYRIKNTNQLVSAVPVEFRDYKDSVMRVAGILLLKLTKHLHNKENIYYLLGPVKINSIFSA